MAHLKTQLFGLALYQAILGNPTLKSEGLAMSILIYRQISTIYTCEGKGEEEH